MALGICETCGNCWPGPWLRNSSPLSKLTRSSATWKPMTIWCRSVSARLPKATPTLNGLLMSIPNLETTLKQLRLSGLAGTVSLRLQEAAANRLSHEEFLEILLQDELNVRQERLLSRRTKAADFHRLKTLEDFDWRFNPNIPRKQIYDLATGQFIHQSAGRLRLPFSQGVFAPIFLSPKSRHRNP